MVPVDDTPGSTNTDEKFECACRTGYRQDFWKGSYSLKFYFLNHKLWVIINNLHESFKVVSYVISHHAVHSHVRMEARVLFKVTHTNAIVQRDISVSIAKIHRVPVTPVNMEYVGIMVILSNVNVPKVIVVKHVKQHLVPVIHAMIEEIVKYFIAHLTAIVLMDILVNPVKMIHVNPIHVRIMEYAISMMMDLIAIVPMGSLVIDVK